ncbi:MAG: DMT family transporter [Deltaproteobacteria bacterium]|nr:DMT family transporter [Deltaproteobacteria bacterium]
MPLKVQLNIKILLGYLCVFGSAFFFYLATVVIKWTRINGLYIDTATFVFARFILGFISVLILMAVKKKKIQIKKSRYLIGRTFSNCIAVYCFFKGVELTSVSQANILNMTYPIFIAIFSWFFLKKQRDIMVIMIVALAFAGVWLILTPIPNPILNSEETSFHPNSLWALASGLSAAIAIMCLNLARQEHDIETILFFLFGLGSIIILIGFFNKMTMPQVNELKYIISCSFFSIIGQYLLTIGFKYVTAIEGGIISSTRILLAAILGPIIAMDPALSLSGWLGVFLIFSANVYLTMRKATH